MPVKENIYRFRALFVLVVFGISLLPRQVLHNFVTSHKHAKFSGHPGKQQVSVASFSCSADDLFLQQSYTVTGLRLPVPDKNVFLPTEKPVVCHAASDERDFTVLRGPPALCQILSYL